MSQYMGHLQWRHISVAFKITVSLYNRVRWQLTAVIWQLAATKSRTRRGDIATRHSDISTRRGDSSTRRGDNNNSPQRYGNTTTRCPLSASVNMDKIRQFIKDYFKNEFMDEINDKVRQHTEASIKDLVTDPMARLEQQLSQMNDLVAKVSAMETAVQFTSKRMDGLERVTLPALVCHVEQVASALALQTLEIDVYRRKWSLTLQGLERDAGEDDADTRRACVQLAR